MLIGKNWIRDFISVRPSLNGSCHAPLNDPNIDIKLLAITSVEFYNELFPFIYIILYFKKIIATVLGKSSIMQFWTANAKVVLFV